MTTALVERRQARRLRRFEEHGVVSVRVRGGRDVWLGDVSIGGLAFESLARVVPGALMHMQLSTPGRVVLVSARVVHCAVTRLGPDGVWYRGGVAFLESPREPPGHELSWLLAGPGDPLAENAERER